MYSFNAMYEAEVYRQDKLHDASMHRQQGNSVRRVRPLSLLVSLLASAVLASWYKPLS